MDTAGAWQVRRVVLSVLFLLVVALPLYPELYGLDEVTPFTQLVAFRPQVLVLVLLVGLGMLLRWNWRIAAVLTILLAVTGGVLTAPRYLSDPQPPPPGTRELTIMVANVLGGERMPPRSPRSSGSGGPTWCRCPRHRPTYGRRSSHTCRA